MYHSNEKRTNYELPIFLFCLTGCKHCDISFIKLQKVFQDNQIQLFNNSVDFEIIRDKDKFLSFFESLRYKFVIQLDDYEIDQDLVNIVNISNLIYVLRKHSNQSNDKLAHEQIETEEVGLIEYFSQELSNINIKVKFYYISTSDIPKVANSEVWYDEIENSTQIKLENYLKKQSKQGKIIFWGKKYKSDTIGVHPTPVYLSTDIKAILTAFVLSVVYEIYDFLSNNHSKENWADKTLHSIDYGISLIDCNGYIIWANKRRKIFHKNNIIGKRCIDEVNCNLTNDPLFQHCIDNRDCLNKNETIRIDDVKIRDYKGREYYVSVVNSAYIDNRLSSHIRQNHLCLVKVVRKTYDKSIIDQQRAELTTANTYSSFLRQLNTTFSALSFRNVQYFEAGIDITESSKFTTDFNFLTRKSDLGEKDQYIKNVINFQELCTFEEHYPKFYTNVIVLESTIFTRDCFGINLGCRGILIPLFFQGKQIGVIVVDNGDNLKNEEIDRLLPEVIASYTSFSNFLSAVIFGIQEREVSNRLSKIGKICNTTIGAKNIINNLLRSVCKDLNCTAASIFQYCPSKHTKQITRKELSYSKDISIQKYNHMSEEYNLRENITGFFIDRCLNEFASKPDAELPLLNLVNLSKTKEKVTISNIWDNLQQNEEISINLTYLKSELDFCIKNELVCSDNTDIQLLFCPLVCDNAVIGCIRFLNYGRIPFSKMDIQVISAVSSHISIIINDAWKSNEHDQTIYAIASTLNQNYSFDKLISVICSNILLRINCESIVLHKIDETNNQLDPYFYISNSEKTHIEANLLPQINFNSSTFNLLADKILNDISKDDVIHHVTHGEFDSEAIFGTLSQSTRQQSYPDCDFKEKNIIIFVFKQGPIKIGSFMAFLRAETKISEEDERFFRILLSFLRIAMINTHELDVKQASLRISTHEFDSLTSSLRYLTSNINSNIEDYNKNRYKLESLKIYDQNNKKVNIFEQLEKYGYKNFLFVDESFSTELEQIAEFAEVLKLHANRTFEEDLNTLEKIRIKDTMKKVIRLLTAFSSEKVTHIRLNCDDKLNIKFYNTYSKILELCLYNVLENAVKYSFNESTVIFEAAIDSLFENIIFTVSNTGVPIEPEQRELVFISGWRSPNVQNLAIGRGLGCSTVRNLLRKYYKGNVSLTQLANPTIFEIKIPLNRLEVENEKQI